MSKTFFLALLATLGLAGAAAPVAAHGWDQPRVGVYLGFGGPAWPGYWGPRPYWGPRYYGYGYAAPPILVPAYPPVVIERAPEVYVERETAPTSPPEQWWYWCRSSQSYYPYVKSCPEGWQKVPPQPTN